MKIPIDLFEAWLKNKNLKDRTIENYIYYFNKFTSDVYNQEAVSKFLSLSQNRNSIARSFLVNFQKFLRVNYKELGIREELYKDIVNVELPKLTGRTKKRIIRPIPHDQILLIEKALETEKLKLMLLVSYYGGLRLGELLKIQIISFNWDGWKKNPEGMGECRVYGKGDKEGIALLPGFVMTRIARYIRNNKFPGVNSKIFINDRKEGANFKNKSRIWQMRLRQAGIKAGITKLDDKGDPVKETVVHPHKLRHSYAKHLLMDKKLDIRAVQEILRHSSIQSTQIYTQLDKEELKAMLLK